MMRRILALAILAVSGLIGNADAGVRGGHFEGTLNYPAGGGDSGYLSTDFAAEGNVLVETYDYGDSIETFPGTYTETDLFIFSIWTATYDDYPDYEISGFCLFGFISTYSVVENDGDDDYSGIVFRTGPASIEN